MDMMDFGCQKENSYKELPDSSFLGACSPAKPETLWQLKYRGSETEPIAADVPLFTFAEFSSGIGDIRLAAERAGGCCVFSSGWDEKSNQTYYMNYGKMPYPNLTVQDVEMIPEHDVFVLSIPQPSFSIIGSGAEGQVRDVSGESNTQRGNAFAMFYHVLQLKRPKAFVAVMGSQFADEKEGRLFKLFSEMVAGRKYSVFSNVVDSTCYVAMKQKKTVIIGLDQERYGLDIDFSLILPTDIQATSLSEILDNDVSHKYTLTSAIWRSLKKRFGARKNFNDYVIRKDDYDRIARVLGPDYCRDGSGVLIEQSGSNPRMLTPREYARLFGFPDTFVLAESDNEAYKELSYSVVVPLLTAVVNLVVSKLLILDKEVKSMCKTEKKVYGRPDLTCENVEKNENFTKQSLVEIVTDAVMKGRAAYCKFLSANDSGETGGHQAGILISVSAKQMFFSEQELSVDSIPKKYGNIEWQNNYSTTCTFTWYESKKELRITGFGRGKSPLRPELTGALFILIKNSEEEFKAFFLNTDEEIQAFLDTFALTPAETNRLITVDQIKPAVREEQAILDYIRKLTVDFPTSFEMSEAARDIWRQANQDSGLILSNPDQILLQWTEEEYSLFRALEHVRYGEKVSRGFPSVDDFVIFANQVLNRRKSRAGKSLEHHLSAIFDANRIQYTAQANTEINKKPDFIFPSERAYHDMTFSIEKLCVLAAKTTCKDRWRQVINEADRLRDQNKYLCTMQQGVSASQMDEMQKERVVLVVPQPFINTYPIDRRDRIWTLKKFVSYIKEIEKTNVGY